MQPESRTPSMDRKDVEVVLEGFEDVLEMDLKKNEGIVESATIDLKAFRKACGHETKKRIHHKNLIKEGKFNKESMEIAVAQCEINIRHFRDKMKLAQNRIDHHQLIVDKLKEELENQYKGLKVLEEQRENGLAD